MIDDNDFSWSSATYVLGARNTYDDGRFCAIVSPQESVSKNNPYALVERGGFLVRCHRCQSKNSSECLQYCTDGCSTASLFSAGAVLDYVPADLPSSSITIYAKEEEGPP